MIQYKMQKYVILQNTMWDCDNAIVTTNAMELLHSGMVFYNIKYLCILLLQSFSKSLTWYYISSDLKPIPFTMQ